MQTVFYRALSKKRARIHSLEQPHAVDDEHIGYTASDAPYAALRGRRTCDAPTMADRAKYPNVSATRAYLLARCVAYQGEAPRLDAEGLLRQSALRIALGLRHRSIVPLPHAVSGTTTDLET